MVLYHWANIYIYISNSILADSTITIYDVIYSMAVMYACQTGTNNYGSLCGHNFMRNNILYFTRQFMLYIVTVMMAYDKFRWEYCVHLTKWTNNNGLNILINERIAQSKYHNNYYSRTYFVFHYFTTNLSTYIKLNENIFF